MTEVMAPGGSLLDAWDDPAAQDSFAKGEDPKLDADGKPIELDADGNPIVKKPKVKKKARCEPSRHCSFHCLS
jgi:hypothetical protein